MHEGTTYHKSEGIIRLAIEELLSKVSRFRCERDECAIDHAVTRSPSVTRDALHPVRCFLFLICIGPLNSLVMEQQEGPDDMMGGVDNGPNATPCPLCNSIHGGCTTDMTKVKQGDGKLRWEGHLIICRVVLEAGAILNKGHKDVKHVRRDSEISMKVGGIILFVTRRMRPS